MIARTVTREPFPNPTLRKCAAHGCESYATKRKTIEIHGERFRDKQDPSKGLEMVYYTCILHVCDRH